MKIKELVEYGRKTLKENGIEDYNIISKSLAKYILNFDDNMLLAKQDEEIKEDEKIRYYLALIEIAQGMPIQYITNKQEFYGYEFYVDENVLIPQPDTEILVEEVLKIIDNFNDNIKILDMCTGSGCIGICLNMKNPDEKITMLDISKTALEIAKKNAENLILDSSNIEFVESDMFENVEEEYDIIVSNPPYIETDELENLDKQVLKEPLLALNGGKDGLDYYKILIEESHKYLSDNGYLCMEIGFNQKDAVIDLLEKNGNYKNIYSKKDLSGNDRIVIAQRA